MSAVLAAPPDWTRQAACNGQAAGDRDPWHPSLDATAAQERRAYGWARAVCLGCPVQVACTRYGLELLTAEPVEGMYGGLRPDQLRSLARRLERAARKQAQHGTRARYVKGCRCVGCRAENARREHERRLGAA